MDLRKSRCAIKIDYVADSNHIRLHLYALPDTYRETSEKRFYQRGGEREGEIDGHKYMIICIRFISYCSTILYVIGYIHVNE